MVLFSVVHSSATLRTSTREHQVSADYLAISELDSFRYFDLVTVNGQVHKQRLDFITALRYLKSCKEQYVQDVETDSLHMCFRGHHG
jgi:hypothetical protein